MIDLGATTISPEEMKVVVTSDYGIRAWLAVWIHQPTAFEEGREFIPQERTLTPDAEEPSPDKDKQRKHPKRSGTIRWAIAGDGLYEFGNAPTTDGSQTRGFLRVSNGMITRLPYSKKADLLATLPSPERRRRSSSDSF